MRYPLSFLALFLAVVIAKWAIACTYVVDPYGTGDFPTIQAAIDVAENGDVICLTEGTFTGDGNRDINYLGKAITVRSQSEDPEICIIDCEGTEVEPHRGFSFVSGEQSTSVLEGITVTGGWDGTPERGAGVRCDSASSPRIDSCVFTGNQGVALSVQGSSSLEVASCRFIQNEAWIGGGIYCRSSSMIIDNCHFAENEAERSGAGIFCYHAAIEITNSTFTQNRGSDAGAMAFHEFCDVSISDCLITDNSSVSSSGITLFLACTSTIERCTFAGNIATSGCTFYTDKINNTTLRNCTFWGNTSPDGTILCGHQQVTLENCVIASDTDGPGIFSYFDYANLICCDIHGNAGGDWVGNIADQFGINGNFSADPLLCGPVNGSTPMIHSDASPYSLHTESPCLPGNHPDGYDCGLIGAQGQGCGPSTVASEPSQPKAEAASVEVATWGRIKARYRR